MKTSTFTKICFGLIAILLIKAVPWEYSTMTVNEAKAIKSRYESQYDTKMSAVILHKFSAYPFSKEFGEISDYLDFIDVIDNEATYYVSDFKQAWMASDEAIEPSTYATKYFSCVPQAVKIGRAYLNNKENVIIKKVRSGLFTTSGFRSARSYSSYAVFETNCGDYILLFEKYDGRLMPKAAFMKLDETFVDFYNSLFDGATGDAMGGSLVFTGEVLEEHRINATWYLYKELFLAMAVLLFWGAIKLRNIVYTGKTVCRDVKNNLKCKVTVMSD